VAAPSPIQILPCPGGEDSRRPDSHADLQPQRVPGGGYAPPKFQRSITDLLLASDGALSTRPGVVEVAALDAPRSAYAYAGALYLHVGTTIVRRDLASGTTTTVATGISDAQPVAWCEHQGALWLTDGTEIGRITAAGVLLPLFPQAAAPAVTLSAGALPAGIYLVAVTWVDMTGAESACAAPTAVTVDGAKSLVVAIPALLPVGVFSVRLWCSRCNEKLLSLVGDFLPAAFPKPITIEPTSIVSLQTAGLDPLPPGAGLTTRGGFMVSWSGSVVSFSHGTWAHLYDPRTDINEVDGTIIGCVGVDGGLWVTNANALFWLDGSDPSKSGLVRTGKQRAYANGGTRRYPGELGVNTAREFAVFASDYGLVFGLSDGSAIAPMSESQQWDVAGKTATFAAAEFNGELYLVVVVT
jgi:hypothetical protein